MKNLRDSQDSCVCSDPTNFHFKDTNVGCVRNCGPTSTDLKYSKEVNKDDQSICDCISGYHYEKTEQSYIGKCIINCVSDAYTLSTHISETQCASINELYLYS